MEQQPPTAPAEEGAEKEAKRAKSAPKQSSLNFVKLLPIAEIEALRGTHLEVQGSFWPETKGRDKERYYDLIILETVPN